MIVPTNTEYPPYHVNVGLTFGELREANATRCKRWHPSGALEWSISDWAVAMAGEAGEICNAVKKLNRIRDGLANLNEADRLLDTQEKAVAAIGEEIADTLIYLDLLALRLGLDLAAEVVKKFNATSSRYGFPEKLPASS